MKVGAHIPGSGLTNYDTLLKSLQKIQKLRGNSFQIFLKPPTQVFIRDYLIDPQDPKIKKFLKLKEKYQLTLVVHAQYVLNFARDSDSTHAKRARKSLLNDLHNCNILGAIGAVVHMGKLMDLSRKQALQNMHDNLVLVLAEMDKQKIKSKLILENSARQGTEVGYTITEIGTIFKMFSEKERKKMGLCLDTCHIFSAGLDIRKLSVVEKLFSDIDKEIGIDKLTVIHFNDSAVPLEGKNDMHEDLLYGYITDPELEGNPIGMRFIVYMGKKLNIPIILETPANKTPRSDLLTKIPVVNQIELIKNWSLK